MLIMELHCVEKIIEKHMEIIGMNKMPYIPIEKARELYKI